MSLHFTVDATRQAPAVACERLSAHLAPLGLSDRDRYRIDLLVEEVLMNAVLHAFRNSAAAHVIGVSLDVDATTVRLRFDDDGIAFDPSTAQPRPPPQSLDEDRPPGGLGLPLLRRFADAMHWERVGGQNHLTLTLRRS